MRFKYSFFISTVSILLCSCSIQLYIPTEGSNMVTLENLKAGRTLYVNNCASCHQLYAPNKYDDSTWKHNLDEMQVRAKITDDQKKLVYDYLINAPK